MYKNVLSCGRQLCKTCEIRSNWLRDRKKFGGPTERYWTVDFIRGVARISIPESHVARTVPLVHGRVQLGLQRNNPYYNLRTPYICRYYIHYFSLFLCYKNLVQTIIWNTSFNIVNLSSYTYLYTPIFNINYLHDHQWPVFTYNISAQTVTVPLYGWEAPDDGQKDCPKHVELLLQIIKNWNSVHLLVIFTGNLSRCTVTQSVTMHGHTILKPPACFL